MIAASVIEQGRLADSIEYRVFNDTYVEMFIEDFAKAGDAISFLEDRGVGEYKRKQTIGADVLQALARVWTRDREQVYFVAGTIFWREMKELASEAYDAD